ncbi:16S rRNA (uracil(1498)-N(3))-methyltransferase [soil metagenome]
MTGPPGGIGSVHVCFADLEAPELAEEDRHHVLAVLRIRPGGRLTASDGDGRWRACSLGRNGRIEPDGESVTVKPPRPAVTVGIALTKGSRPELVVQKLTELGIERIVPFVAARSVVRWEGERASRHLVRLRRVAREASMQCGRVTLPAVEDLTAFATAASRPGVAMARVGGDPPSLARPSVLVGPEGGWAQEELDLRLPAVGLGSLVLRAETAAITAAALLTGLRLGLVREGSP